MKKRIFAAVGISDEARLKAADYIQNLRLAFPRARVGWEKPEKLHLTLKFVGEIDDERLAAFLRAVDSAARQISGFKLQVAGAGVFPSPRSARVLWLGLKDEAENLRALNEILERECETEGFPKEKRAFKPHLTIGRIKSKPDERLIRQHLKGNFEPPPEFGVSEVVVLQSELLPAGSKYSIVSRAAFRTNAAQQKDS